MAQARKLRELLDRRVVFLDGGAGTWLLEHGMPGDGSTEEWALEHRELLSRMHREYIEAGPDMILTCTFGGTGPKLGSARRVFDVNCALAETALKTAGGKVLVGASVGPTGELLHPSGTLTWNDAYRCYLDQARALSRTGIDIFFLETFSDPRELKAAILAVRDTSPDGFISAQMSFGSEGRTLSGTGPSALAAFMDRLPVDACGANC